MTDWTKEINQQSLDQNLLGEKILTNAVYVTPEELKLLNQICRIPEWYSCRKSIIVK